MASDGFSDVLPDDFLYAKEKSMAQIKVTSYDNATPEYTDSYSYNRAAQLSAMRIYSDGEYYYRLFASVSG